MSAEVSTMTLTYYDVLGVSRDASPEEIRRAWRSAADRFEPGGESSTRQFRLFNEAAEVLLDPPARARYDATLATAAPSQEDAPDEPASSVAEVPGPPLAGAGVAATASLVHAATDAPPVDTSAPPAADAASDTTESSPARGGAGRRSVVWFAVLAVLATVAVAAGAYFGTRGWAAYQEEQQAQTYQQSLEEATAAAENAALAVLAYDHESLEADRDAAAKFLTDDYRPEYVETFDTLVTPTASETKATVEATVLASAAMTAGSRERPNQIPVLLFVNQATTSSTTSGQPRVALNRVRFDMVRVDGTWRVDAITSY